MHTLRRLLGLLAVAAGSLTALTAAAQQQPFEVIPNPGQTILRGGPTGVVGLLETITNWAFVLLLVLAVLFIILAAYKYLFSGGSDEAVETAHKMIIYAVVAVAVAFLAKGIIFVVRQLVTTGGGSSGGSSLNIQYQNDNVNLNVGF